MSEAKQSKIDFEVWEYILPALPMIAEVRRKKDLKNMERETGKK